MKNIQIKLKDSEKVVETFDLVDGELLILDAQRGVNYELLNTLSGLAPQNIITKRIDQDLLIILDEGEGGGSPDEIVPDVVIKGYYGEMQGEAGNTDATGVLVGLHQNGKYYAYIPESSDPTNAVSVLEDNMAEPQAIGGQEIENGTFTFSPWYVLFGATALYILTADDDSSGATAEPNPMDYSIGGDDIVISDNKATITESGKLDLSSENIQTKLHGADILDLTQNNVSVKDLIIDNAIIDKLVGKDEGLVINADDNDIVKVKGGVFLGDVEMEGITYHQYDLNGDKIEDLLISGITPEII
ncbi:Uncharacterised protein [Phocoenobacter uteri]|uniref:Uncharacterized protein n=1 Tax=Phocoenobacter uteri TaxID=146806 RepID=A0A379C991_9PAST|nr:hypothetical protein [Phocoenobacter uteri]MDG6882116.1 hypothetical protein [Phocoenobacter uteri]SUB58266.1 Uncharacterised protein [Phocoenobacter uteri]